jgi:hypothetical protein
VPQARTTLAFKLLNYTKKRCPFLSLLLLSPLRDRNGEVVYLISTTQPRFLDPDSPELHPAPSHGPGAGHVSGHSAAADSGVERPCSPLSPTLPPPRLNDARASELLSAATAATAATAAVAAAAAAAAAATAAATAATEAATAAPQPPAVPTPPRPVPRTPSPTPVKRGWWWAADPWVASASLRRRRGSHAVGPQVGAGGVEGEALPLDGGRQLRMLVATAREEEGENGEAKHCGCGRRALVAWGVRAWGRGTWGVGRGDAAGRTAAAAARARSAAPSAAPPGGSAGAAREEADRAARPRRRRRRSRAAARARQLLRGPLRRWTTRPLTLNLNDAKCVSCDA